jgi:hypothetical protein
MANDAGFESARPMCRADSAVVSLSTAGPLSSVKASTAVQFVAAAAPPRVSHPVAPDAVPDRRRSAEPARATASGFERARGLAPSELSNPAFDGREFPTYDASFRKHGLAETRLEVLGSFCEHGARA